jgi:DNA-binding CsgD family transcriptional regulator/PAS domain-containing protein
VTASRSLGYDLASYIGRYLPRSRMPARSEDLSRLIGSVYSAAADPALWDQFLGELAHITGAQSAGLVMLDVTQETFMLSSSFNVDPEATRLYQQYFGPMDIWAQRGLSKPAGYVCPSEALCSLREIRLSEIYNEFMVRFGIEHGLFGVVENDGQHWASVSLYRDKSSAAFDSVELDIVHFLAPHMQRAFEMHLKFSALKMQSAGLREALDLLPGGVIFLGPKGRVLLMNRSASTILSERDGLLATSSGLRAQRAEESYLLETTIRRALDAKSLSAGGTVLISRRELPPLKVQISPIRDTAMMVPEAISAVAFITDPLQRSRRAPEVLRERYGLTPAECRVTMLLLDGKTPKEIAGDAKVTVDTVRSQIRSIFGKTGVNRQSDLIRLLLTIQG